MGKLDELLYSMFTENTGSHPLDSGGAYGRRWQTNKTKKIEDFHNKPSATMSLELSKDGDLWCTGYASTWHHLNRTLSLDSICDSFNALIVDDWDGDKAYGLSLEGQTFLEDLGAEFGECWNTYNWENNWDETLQGCHLELDGTTYVLLQYHGGCDVRGGYTDAKLFKLESLESDYFLYGDTISGPSFEEIDNGIDIYGTDLVDHATGCELPKEVRDYVIKHYDLKPGGKSVEIEASASEF